MNLKTATHSRSKPLILNLLFIALIIVSIKWTISFLYNPLESFFIKNILDIEDTYYFPYLINLLQLDFMPNYLEDSFPNKIIPLPIYSILIHSVFYKIFSNYSFILLEYFSVSVFLFLLFKIFQEINITKYKALVFSLSIFLLPDLLIFTDQITKINFFNINIIKNLYSFRFPRPLITSLYFFWGILLAIWLYKDNFTNKIYFLIGLNLALNFGSFYYHFTVLAFLFSTIFIIKFFNQRIFFIKKIYIVIFSFLLFSIPFLFILYFSEYDFAIRVGTISLNITQKIELSKYLIGKILSLKFLLLFLVNSYLFLRLCKQDFFCKKTISVLYLLFISAILAPIIFIILSPAVSEIYHFINIIVLVGLLIFFIFIILYLSLIFKKFIKNKNIFFREATYYFIVTLFLIFFTFNYSVYHKNIHSNEFRKDVVILNNFFKKNKDKLNSILTFNPVLQSWWVFNNKKKLTTIDSAMTSATSDDLEVNFLKNLKYLNISSKNFSELLVSKKKSGGWRYENKYIKYFSWYKYQANSLITYNNSRNFEKDTLKYIDKSSPLKTQQIIMPKDEIERLNVLYDKILNLKFSEPDLIVLKKESDIFKYATINLIKFCTLKSTKSIKIFVNKNKINCEE